ncbi:4-hydroxyphenylpyruvate dioxygenase [Glycine max]|uniref:4-hydroxyphenylpyruvate dioxygenase n=1 Tax=Glycine max TaxID=3847 RepID=A0A0R0GEM8_SOYBN|nr:4-hydroxyphenylpyruvate dioxygenase [Glycine max]
MVLINLSLKTHYDFGSCRTDVKCERGSRRGSHRSRLLRWLLVRAIALEVADTEVAFIASVVKGAEPASPPVLLNDRIGFVEVRLYGDVVLRYVSYKDVPHADPSGWFLPGFEALASSSSFSKLDYGIRRLDHTVRIVSELASTMRYLKGFSGFHKFTEDVGMSETELNYSMVLANNSETVLLPLNESVYGTKRKSQIETYLEHNKGAGVQHLALVTHDIFTTLREMRKRSFVGRFEFMPSPPPTYYANLHNHATNVLTVDQIKHCEELGILVDRDDTRTCFAVNIVIVVLGFNQKICRGFRRSDSQVQKCDIALKLYHMIYA